MNTDTITNYAIIISILTLGYLFWIITKKVNKLPIILRYILILPYSLIAFVVLGLAIRLLLAFVPESQDDNGDHVNIGIVAFIILPIFTSYTFVNASSYMAPKFKVLIAYVLSIFLISAHFFIYYIKISYKENDLLAGLLDLFYINRGEIGGFYLISFIIGIIFAIKHAKSQTSFIGFWENQSS